MYSLWNFAQNLSIIVFKYSVRLIEDNGAALCSGAGERILCPYIKCEGVSGSSMSSSLMCVSGRQFNIASEIANSPCKKGGVYVLTSSIYIYVV